MKELWFQFLRRVIDLNGGKVIIHTQCCFSEGAGSPVCIGACLVCGSGVAGGLSETAEVEECNGGISVVGAEWGKMGVKLR